MENRPRDAQLKKQSVDDKGDPGKSSQPQMNAVYHGYSMRCLYSPARQKGEWPRCINVMIHLLSSVFICG